MCNASQLLRRVSQGWMYLYVRVLDKKKIYKGVISSRLKMANSSISANFPSSLRLYHLVLLSFFFVKNIFRKKQVHVLVLSWKGSPTWIAFF